MHIGRGKGGHVGQYVINAWKTKENLPSGFKSWIWVSRRLGKQAVKDIALKICNGIPKCFCGCGKEVSWCEKSTTWLPYADGCHGNRKRIFPSTAEFWTKYKGMTEEQAKEKLKEFRSFLKEVNKKNDYTERNKRFSGDGNPMSLVNIAKRNGCSLDDAHKFTPMYNKFTEDLAAKRTRKIYHWGHIVNTKERKKLFFQSSYEVAYIIYCLLQGKTPKRNRRWIKYVYEGRHFRFLPDFKIGNEIHEIKGWKTDKDLAKFASAKKLLGDKFVVVDGPAMKQILKSLKKIYKQLGETEPFWKIRGPYEKICPKDWRILWLKLPSKK